MPENRKRRPSKRWFQHAGVDERDAEEKERFRKRLSACLDVLAIVRTEAQRYEDEIRHNEENVEDFQDAAWAYKQAFRNGERAALRHIQRFIPDPEEINEE